MPAGTCYIFIGFMPEFREFSLSLSPILTTEASMKPQLLIASPISGSGKTTFALGLLRALRQRGLHAQPFKCGTDYIDTQYHALAAGHDSVNLDTWLASDGHIQTIYNKYAEQADVCVTEGTAGLFDGYNRMQGSNAHIARLLKIPVVLIVNARATAYSVAPILYGFKHFKRYVQVVGVVFNQVASPAHLTLLQEACMDAGVECLGYLPVVDDFKLPPRHSGLVLSVRQSMDEQIDRIASLIEKHVNIDKLLSLCERIFPCQHILPYTSESELDNRHIMGRKELQIAIARDPAFCLLSQENVDSLARNGQISYFSPLYGSDLPSADLVYLPGGYPELFARQLYRRKRLFGQLRDYIEGGGKLLAECGGMVLLSHSLTARQGGTAYEMANIFPFDFTMTARTNAGYRQAEYHGITLRGYESHYTETINPEENSFSAIPVYTMRGSNTSASLFRYKNVFASLVRWYWGETEMLDLWGKSQTETDSLVFP